MWLNYEQYLVPEEYYLDKQERYNFFSNKTVRHIFKISLAETELYKREGYKFEFAPLIPGASRKDHSNNFVIVDKKDVEKAFANAIPLDANSFSVVITSPPGIFYQYTTGGSFESPIFTWVVRQIHLNYVNKQLAAVRIEEDLMVSAKRKKVVDDPELLTRLEGKPETIFSAKILNMKTLVDERRLSLAASTM